MPDISTGFLGQLRGAGRGPPTDQWGNEQGGYGKEQGGQFVGWFMSVPDMSGAGSRNLRGFPRQPTEKGPEKGPLVTDFGLSGGGLR